jgi:hypothetical protein
MRWAVPAIAFVALTGLAACGSTTTPSGSSSPSVAATSTATAVSGVKTTAETCAAIKTVRTDLLKAFLGVSVLQAGSPEADRKTAADAGTAAVAKAVADLTKVGADSGDPALKKAIEDFVAGLGEVLVAVKAAGTDTTKLLAAVDNEKANSAEKTILQICGAS